MLSLKKKNTGTVGLDVEAGSVAATEVRSNGHVAVTRYGVLPLGPGVSREGEVTDPQELGAALKQLFAEHQLSKSVRLGVANQRVAVRTLRLPPIENRSELETAIRFQAQDHIPMPLDQAVLDWQVVGRGTNPAGDEYIEVVTVAARRDMVGGALEALRLAGLRPVGIDHAAFGMIRALAGEPHAAVGTATYVDAPDDVAPGEGTSGYEGAPSYPEAPGYQGAPSEYQAAPSEPATVGTDPAGAIDAQMPIVPAPAKLYCNLGDVTNLAVARGSDCLFTRIAAFGVEGIAQRLAERRQLTLEHARQWLTHVGLESPTEGVDGDPETVGAARDALLEGASRLADELRLSLEFYAAQEAAVPVSGVVACGPGTTIPGLAERVQRELGQHVEIGRPAALAHLEDGAAARLTLSYGLALEE